ncbi:putative Ig domain-containing protein [uncultured Nostoc sp.]|uniref:putative Ig domain-containing protein n=1 Tax=uncultured Nostoc sp. TaxID=340711 RepID=UPI0035CB4BAA
MALTQDDIAFISFNADEDGWSIVTFVDIDPNTTIYFTDNEATSLTAFNTGESYFQWNSEVNTINAGTVIRFSAIDNAVNLAASIGTFSRVSVSGSSNYGLSASGDTIYAYLGSSANSPTVFLSGISNDTNSQGTTDLTAAGLTIGTNSILLNSSADYGVYNGSRNGESSFATYKLSVNNVNNWTVDTVNGDYTTTVANTTNFAIASRTPTVNLSVNTNSGTESGTTQITVTATASSVVSGNQTVNLAVTGTGITATDYNLSNTVIAILHGQTAGLIAFTIVDDAVIEGTETATLTISNPSPGISLGSTTIQNITITDNDLVVGQAPTIQLDTASTTNLLDANSALSATGTGAISGVIGNANDPAKTVGVNFAIAESDTPVENLTVTVTSGNTAVVPNGNITLTGTGVNRNLKINPVSVGNANIIVTVSDGTSTAEYAIAYSASANNSTATTQFLTGTNDASTAIPVSGTTWDGKPNSKPQLRAATFSANFNPEGIINIPDNLTNTSQIQFVSDDGNSVLYNDGTAAKDLSENNFKKFRTDSITLGAVVFTPRIHDIQGASHISGLNGQKVADVAGIVTVLKSNGFYLQDPNPDSDDRTSEGIFVFTSSAPTVQVGDSVLVDGTVSEFRPGGATSANLTTTEIISLTIAKLSSGNALPTATILGNGGRTIPTSVIDNDTTGNIETGTTTFDPAQDGIDFYESLEAMRVQVNNPVAVSPTNSFGEIWLLADNGVNATGRTACGGVAISPNDFNPERIQIDDTLFTSGSSPQVNVGATFSTITGVVDYSFSNYEVLPTSVTVTSNTLTKEITNLTPTNDQLTVATFNVENLDPGDGATKFNNLASRIVNNLKAPDIISLEEIQDNNGPTNDSVVDASTTFQTLIDAITAAGGPTYQYRQINPVDDTNGGEPGGNIRVGFLFNPNRVSFVDRPGGTSTSNTTVSNVSGVPTVSNSPGLIVYIIGNHFNSKGGDQPLYGSNQPPTLTSEVQRQQQATVVKNFVESILAINPNANIVVAGDLNDFEFSNPVSILESAGLTSLIETLPQNQRYTYNFQGNAQTLDHVLVSNNLRSKLDRYDVVHVNSEFADQDSDHDLSVARFNLAKNNAPTVQPLDDQIISTNKAFSFNVSNKFADIDGDTLIYSATGLPTGSSIVANTGVISGTISQIGIFGVTVTAADGQGGNVSDTFDLTVANNKATSGNDIIFVSELTDFKKYIVHALAGSDRVIGTNNNELIDDGSGNDYLDGKGNADVLLGDDGNDTILGGLGNDGLFGGNDNDRLIGWGGGTNEIDFLNGEQGADTYILGDVASVFYTSSHNNDYADIFSFQASDQIQLKGVANNYSLGSVRSAVGIFTNNGVELIAVVENGLNCNTNLATDTRFVFV